MAKGDRIAIADKATLDAVSTNVSGNSTKLDNANTKLDSLLTKENYLTSTQISKIRNPSITAGAGSTVAFNVSGAGVFYYFLHSNNNNTVSYTITFPGDSNISRVATAVDDNNYGGVLAREMLFLGSSLMTYGSSGGTPLSGARMYDASISTAAPGVWLLPKPIRFTNGFSVTINSNASTTCQCYYRLD